MPARSKMKDKLYRFLILYLCTWTVNIMELDQQEKFYSVAKNCDRINNTFVADLAP